MEDIINTIISEFNMGSWFYLISAVFITFVLDLILAFRYKVLLWQVNGEISILNSLYASLASAFLTFMSPFTAGVLITKPLATKTLSKISIKKSAFATIFENFFDFTWQVLLLPFLLIGIGWEKLLGDVGIEMGIFILFIGFTILIFKNYKRAISIIWRFRWILPEIIRKKSKERGLMKSNAEKFIDIFIRHLSERRFLIKIFIPTLILILLLPVVAQLCALTFSVSITYKTAFIVSWIPSIIGHLSGIPKGLGSKDITMIGFLTFFGIDAKLAVEIAILHRLVSMSTQVLLGGPICLYVWKKIAL